MIRPRYTSRLRPLYKWSTVAILFLCGVASTFLPMRLRSETVPQGAYGDPCDRAFPEQGGTHDCEPPLVCGLVYDHINGGFAVSFDERGYFVETCQRPGEHVEH